MGQVPNASAHVHAKAELSARALPDTGSPKRTDIDFSERFAKPRTTRIVFDGKLQPPR